MNKRRNWYEQEVDNTCKVLHDVMLSSWVQTVGLWAPGTKYWEENYYQECGCHLKYWEEKK